MEDYEGREEQVPGYTNEATADLMFQMMSEKITACMDEMTLQDLVEMYQNTKFDDYVIQKNLSFNWE